MRTIQQRAPAREQLRSLLGDDVADELSSRSCGRVLAAAFAAARAELERAHRYDGQPELEPARRSDASLGSLSSFSLQSRNSETGQSGLRTSLSLQLGQRVCYLSSACVVLEEIPVSGISVLQFGHLYVLMASPYAPNASDRTAAADWCCCLDVRPFETPDRRDQRFPRPLDQRMVSWT
jgi:hypothetical protein